MYEADGGRYGVMKYRRCGKSGLLLPEVSLGLWHNFGSSDSFDNMLAMIHAAFDAGVTHFDLANNYGPVYGAAEENFGRIMEHDMKPYRDEMVVSTKAGYDMWPGPYGNFGSRKYLIASLDQSRSRMGLDYVDIFYHHRPDYDTPLEETAEALSDIVRSGKALYVGISNYDPERTRRIAEILRENHTPLLINQVRYSMLDRHIERERLPEACREVGAGVICFSPLAQGVLSDRYLDGIPADSRAAKNHFLRGDSITPELISKVRALGEAAWARGQKLSEMALSWVLRRGEITSVIVGASRPEQIKDNLRAVGGASFSEEELCRIDEILG